MDTFDQLLDANNALEELEDMLEYFKSIEVTHVTKELKDSEDDGGE